MNKVVALFLIWFLVINFFGLVANNRVNLKADTAFDWINPDFTFQKQDWDLIDTHSRWDSYWFLDITQNGYYLRGEHELANVAFFPLYPLLMGFTSLFFSDLVFSGWLVSSVFTLLAVIFLYKLVDEFHKDSDPILACFLLLIFPTAFFLNSIYSESTYLFFSILAFYYARKQNYLVSGVTGMLASLTRITGVLLFLPLLLEYFQNQKRKVADFKLGALLLVPLGTTLFFLYHFFRFGDFFLYLKIEELWGRGFNFDMSKLSSLTNPAISNYSLDSLFVVLGIVSTILVFLKVRKSYALYMASVLFVALSSGTTMSIGRYILLLFPIYILVASTKNNVVKYSWIFFSTLLLGLYTLLFVAHYWAG